MTPTGFTVNGQDIEEYFEPYVSGAKAITTSHEVSGVDLKDIFAPWTSGALAPATGFKVAGADINTLFQSSGGGGGTGIVAAPGYAGAHYSTALFEGGTDPVLASAFFELFDNGTWELRDQASTVLGSGNWYLPTTGSIGAGYQAKATVTALNGGSSVNGLSSFAVIDAGTVELKATWVGADGDVTKRFDVLIEIKPTGGSVESSGTFRVGVTAGRDTGG